MKSLKAEETNKKCLVCPHDCKQTKYVKINKCPRWEEWQELKWKFKNGLIKVKDIAKKLKLKVCSITKRLKEDSE